MLLQESCQIIKKKDINDIFDSFANALGSENSETLAESSATLTDVEKAFIEQNCDKLSKMFLHVGLKLNKDKFMEMVEKIFYAMPTIGQRGGVDTEDTEDKEVELKGRKKSFVRYDLYAIVTMLFSFFIIFLAFLQLNQMLYDATGDGTIELSKKLKNQIIETIQSVPRNDLPLLEYIYNLFNQVCSDIGSNVKTTLTSKATNVIYYTFDNFNAEAIKICSTKQTGLLGVMDGIVKTVFNSRGTSDCVISQQVNLYKHYTDNLAYKAAIEMKTLEMGIQHIKSLFVAGLGLGGTSIAYLKYRYNQTSSSPLLSIESGNEKSITRRRRGGMRSRYGRRTMKSKKAKKSKKSKKLYRKSMKK